MLLKIFAVVFASLMLSVEPGQLVINEVCFETIGPDEEWVELLNITSSDIVLDSTVYISDGEGIYFFDNFIVPAGGFITLKIRSSGAFPFEPDLDISHAGIILANATDQVFIKRGETLIDSIKYYRSWVRFEGHPLERRNPYYSGLHPSNWVSSFRESGTPGARNSTYSPTLEFPPAILRFSHSPQSPRSTETTIVDAMIIDERSLASAILHYGFGDISGEAPLVETGEYQYRAEIPAVFSHADVVEYYIIAIDDADRADTSQTRAYFVVDSIVEGPVVINEIMYHTPGPDVEWVEFFNRRGEAIDMSGWTLRNSTASVFTFPEETIIEGDGFIVAIGNEALFTAEYDIDNFVGDFPFSLRNSGDSIILKDDSGRLIDVVEYSTGRGWPPVAHGDGYSLQLDDPNSDNSNPANWSGSTTLGGTPGTHNDAVEEAIFIPTQFAIKSISPNPFNSFLRIDYYTATKANIEIYDIRGNLRYSAETGKDREGFALVDASSFNSGVYIIRLLAGDRYCQAKAVLVK